MTYKEKVKSASEKEDKVINKEEDKSSESSQISEDLQEIKIQKKSNI